MGDLDQFLIGPTALVALNGAVAPAPPKEEPDATGNGTAEVH